MKECRICKSDLPIENFSIKDKKTGRRNTTCNKCRYLHRPAGYDESRRVHYLLNKERINAANKKYYNDKLDYNVIRSKKYYNENLESATLTKRIWRKNNLDKMAATSSKIRAIKKFRLINIEGDKQNIASIYKQAKILEKQTKIKHHVDHIIPLINDNVSGLHVSWNLQVLPVLSNLKKNNRFDGTYDNDSWGLQEFIPAPNKGESYESYTISGITN